MFTEIIDKYYKKQSKYNCILLCVIVVTQIIVAGYFEYYKDSMFGDELFSYAFANAYFTNTTNNTTNSYTANAFIYFYKWLDSSVWQNMFTVQEGQRFAYDSVIYNQNFDISPPLHTLLLHSVSSLFLNVFSKWFGFGINVVFFCLAQFFLYRISCRLFSDKRAGLLVCAIYGFSWGGLNTLVYLRMYMMMVCFALGLTYMAIMHFENTIQDKRNSLMILYIFLCSLCGILTHMHFLLFAFFTGLFCVSLLWIYGYWYDGFKFGCTLLGSVIVAVFLYPRMIDVLLGRGEAGFFIDIKTGYFYQIVQRYLGIMNYEMFGGFGRLFFLFFVLLIVARILVEYLNYKSIQRILDTFESCIRCKRIIFYNMFMVAIATFLLMSYVTVYLSNKYLYLFYPFVVVFVVSVMLMFHDKFRLVVYLALLLISYNTMEYNTKNLYAYEMGQSEISRIVADYRANAVIVEKAESFWPLICRGEMLMETPYCYLTTIDKFDEAVGEIKQKDDDRLLVYIADNVNIDHNVLIKQYTKKLGYMHYEKICDIAGSNYLLSK